MNRSLTGPVRLAAGAGAVLLLGTALGGPTAYAGSTAVALTTGNQLLTFDTDTPGTASSPVAVTGLQSGESLVGIDFRPNGGQLYGLGNSAQLYTIDPTTGAATAVGPGSGVPLNGLEFGFDFNPAADRIRVVSELNQNARLNPDTGTVVDADPATDGTQLDGILAYAAGDTNASAEPGVQAAAYTNNDNDAATGTTLYVIDSTLGVLATQNPPNDGTLNTVGSLGVTNLFVGFDIANAANDAFVVTSGTDGDGHGGTGPDLAQLYTINLGTGAATLVGSVGDGSLGLRGLAISPVTQPPPNPIPLPSAMLLFVPAAVVAGWTAHRMRRHA